MLIFLIAFSLRISLFAAISVRNPSGFLDTDSSSYLQVAEELSRHGTYTGGGIPEHSRTPGYPLFLAAFMKSGAGTRAMVAGQIVFGSLTCVLAAVLAFKLTGNMPASLAAGLIAAADVPSIVMANLLMTETLFTFFLFLSVLLFFNKNIKIYFLSGVFMGISILFRPIAAFLPAAAALFIVLFNLPRRRKNLIAAAVYLAGCAVIISPWLIRNKIVFNSAFISTISSKNMLYYRAAGVHSVKHEIPLAASQSVLLEAVDSCFPDSRSDPVKRAGYERMLGKKIILENPGIYAINHLRSSFAMLLSPMRSSIDVQLGLKSTGSTLDVWRMHNIFSVFQRMRESTSSFTFYIVIFQMFMTLIVSVLMMPVLVRVISGKAPLSYSTPLLAIAYFVLLSGGPEAYARFRVPIVPFIAVVSGMGIIN